MASKDFNFKYCKSLKLVKEKFANSEKKNCTVTEPTKHVYVYVCANVTVHLCRHVCKYDCFTILYRKIKSISNYVNFSLIMRY